MELEAEPSASAWAERRSSAAGHGLGAMLASLSPPPGVSSTSDADADDGAAAFDREYSRKSLTTTDLVHGKEYTKRLGPMSAHYWRVLVTGRTLVAVRVWSVAGAVQAFASFEVPEPDEAHHEYATGSLGMDDTPAELLVRGTATAGSSAYLYVGVRSAGGATAGVSALFAPHVSLPLSRPVRGTTSASKREYLVAHLPPAPLSGGERRARRILLETSCGDGCGVAFVFSHDFPYPDAEHSFATVLVPPSRQQETALELEPHVTTLYIAVEARPQAAAAPASASPMGAPTPRSAHYSISIRFPRRGSNLLIGWAPKRLAAFFRGLVSARGEAGPDAAAEEAEGDGESGEESPEGAQEAAGHSTPTTPRTRRTSLQAHASGAASGRGGASRERSPSTTSVGSRGPLPSVSPRHSYSETGRTPGASPQASPTLRALPSPHAAMSPSPPAGPRPPRPPTAEHRPHPRVAAAIADAIATARAEAEAAQASRSLRRLSGCSPGPVSPGTSLRNRLPSLALQLELELEGEEGTPLSERERRVTVGSCDLTEFRTRVAHLARISGAGGNFPALVPASPGGAYGARPSPPLAPGAAFSLPRRDSFQREHRRSESDPPGSLSSPNTSLRGRRSSAAPGDSPREPAPPAVTPSSLNRTLPISSALLAGRRESIRFRHEERSPHEHIDPLELPLPLSSASP